MHRLDLLQEKKITHPCAAPDFLLRSAQLKTIFLKELAPHESRLTTARTALQKSIDSAKAGKGYDESHAFPDISLDLNNRDL